MNPPRHLNLTPSQAALRLGVSAKALRIYEQAGLIAPGRSPAGWRLYGPGDLERAATIVCLRGLGLSLSQIARTLNGDSAALEAGLAAHEQQLHRQAEHIDTTLRRISELRSNIREGQKPDPAMLNLALGGDAATAVGFELPWPWAGEWFELRAVPPLNFITGPLGSGKTSLAQRLAAELPEAAFIGPDRAPAVAWDRDAALAARVERTMAWLVEDGAVRTDALLALVVALEADAPSILVIDMVEERLCDATQRALIARLRATPGHKRALFLMTRSSSILDLDLARRDEAVIYCPANHSPPFRADLHPGGRGHEAVTTCLAAPEVRARTAGVIAIRADAGGSQNKAGAM